MPTLLRIIGILGVFFFLAGGRSFAEKAGAAEGSPGNIEVYMAGKKFASLDDYENTRKQAAAVVPSLSAAKKLQSLQEIPLTGKTLIISGNGTVITSHDTIDEGKTITLVPPQEPGRVAGVEPSFRQGVKDFESGAPDNGVLPQAVSSAATFGEALHDKIGTGDRPVLLISDKRRVRVMQLEGKSQ